VKAQNGITAIIKRSSTWYSCLPWRKGREEKETFKFRSRS